MLDFRAPEWNDAECDNCGLIAVAVIQYGGITIPLCEDCLNDLREGIKKYDNEHFCHKCEYFGGSKDGPKTYGGSCLAKSNIPPEAYGYTNHVDYFDICHNDKYSESNSLG